MTKSAQHAHKHFCVRHANLGLHGCLLLAASCELPKGPPLGVILVLKIVHRATHGHGRVPKQHVLGAVAPYLVLISKTSHSALQRGFYRYLTNNALLQCLCLA